MNNKSLASVIVVFGIAHLTFGLPQSAYYLTRATVPTLSISGRPYAIQTETRPSLGLVSAPVVAFSGSSGVSTPIVTEQLIISGQQPSVTPARVRSTYVPSMHLPVPNFYTSYPYPSVTNY